MQHSPAEVVRQWLLNEGLGLAIGLKVEWAVYVTAMPDTNEQHDNLLSVRDTAGITQGRQLATGEVIEKPGIMIAARTVDHQAGWRKMQAIKAKMDQLLRATITVDGVDYKIHAFNRRGNVISSGVDRSDSRKRSLFTLNSLITIKEME